MLDTKLYTFMKLIECGSTIKCAESLHITQPAVSQQIHALEEQYHISLFQKEGRLLRLTSQGKEFATLARRLMAMDNRFTELIQPQNKNYLSFGATFSIGESIMPALLPCLLKKLPEYQIHMAVKNTHTLLEMLEDGEIDFALIEGNFEHKRYTSYPFFSCYFSGLCKRNGRFSSVKSLHELQKAPLILRETGSGTRDIFENECLAHNVSPNDFTQVHEIENVPAILSLVSQDLGVTFAYEIIAGKLLKEGILQIIPLEDFHLKRQLSFVFLPDTPLTPQNEKMHTVFQDLLDISFTGL